MFKQGKQYYIDGKPFRYDGKTKDREHYQFTSVDNPDDVRQVLVYASRYAYQISRQEVDQEEEDFL
jgi:hypothetical protein